MPRLTPIFRLLCFLLLLCVPTLRASAADAARRPFNLPADDAEHTLRLFATQSGLEVLFSRPSTVGVRTPALQGDFPPFEAITRLLAGTRGALRARLAVSADELDSIMELIGSRLDASVRRLLDT